MLDRARTDATEAGATNAEFLQADVQTYRFDPRSFDVAISRFGVMFFDEAAAFANVAAGLRPEGRLTFVCWQELARNEWLLLPGLAAAQYLSLPAAGPGPGPFSLADREALAAPLRTAGFSDVDIAGYEVPMLLGGGGTLDETVDFLMNTGIARAMFEGAEPDAAKAAIAAVRDVLGDHHEGEGVRLGTATWVVTARRTG